MKYLTFFLSIKNTDIFLVYHHHLTSRYFKKTNSTKCANYNSGYSFGSTYDLVNMYGMGHGHGHYSYALYNSLYGDSYRTAPTRYYW